MGVVLAFRTARSDTGAAAAIDRAQTQMQAGVVVALPGVDIFAALRAATSRSHRRTVALAVGAVAAEPSDA